MLSAQRALAERHPDEAAAWLDVALTEALRFGRTAKAREALDRARAQPATELAHAFADIASSICSLHEGTPRAALAEIEDARERLAQAATKTNRASPDNLAQWVRACCLAELDEVEHASEVLAAASPMLLATREHALVDQAHERLARARERREVEGGVAKRVGP